MRYFVVVAAGLAAFAFASLADVVTIEQIVCKVNGVEVAKGTGAAPDHGTIGWQSEGKPIKFRNMMIKPLD